MTNLTQPTQPCPKCLGPLNCLTNRRFVSGSTAPASSLSPIPPCPSRLAKYADRREAPDRIKGASGIRLLSVTRNRPNVLGNLSSLKGRSGVYLWTHKESGLQYVGSSRNLAHRISQYT